LRRCITYTTGKENVTAANFATGEKSNWRSLRAATGRLIAMCSSSFRFKISYQTPFDLLADFAKLRIFFVRPQMSRLVRRPNSHLVASEKVTVTPATFVTAGTSRRVSKLNLTERLVGDVHETITSSPTGAT
jgi:hypothetical protein